jgi:RNase P/RNase MRP subunit POP5
MSEIVGNILTVSYIFSVFEDAAYTSSAKPATIDLVQFRFMISKLCQQIYGVAGSGIQVDILRYDEDNYTGILRVATRHVSSIHSIHPYN